MIHVKELYTEHVEIGLAHPTYTKLDANDRKPSVEAHYLAHDDASGTDKGYIVSKMEALSKPFADADVVEDQTTIWTCCCDGFYFHHCKGSVIPSGECKHVTAARKLSRESVAKGQATL